MKTSDIINKISSFTQNISHASPPLSVKEISSLLALDDFSPVYTIANQIKQAVYQNKVFVRAILEFSNYCRVDCKYCGLNCHNKNVARYRLSKDEIIENVLKADDAGYKTIVLQSGEDKFFTKELLGEIVKEVKKTGITVTLSCGEMPFNDYAYLKECGADRYLLKHETSDEAIYSSLHSFSTLKNRVDCLKNLKKLGYDTGSGFMVGLPSQTLETIANDLLLIYNIPCDMSGIGPFIPHPDTPLKDLPCGSTELTKRAVAILRIMLPYIHLPATTSLGVINKSEKDNIFSCGANVIMKKITPDKYKKLYEIYPSNLSKTDIYNERKELVSEIENLNCLAV